MCWSFDRVVTRVYIRSQWFRSVKTSSLSSDLSLEKVDVLHIGFFLFLDTSNSQSKWQALFAVDVWVLRFLLDCHLARSKYNASKREGFEEGIEQAYILKWVIVYASTSLQDLKQKCLPTSGRAHILQTIRARFNRCVRKNRVIKKACFANKRF